MKVKAPADVVIRWASEIEPDVWYGKGCFAYFSFHRGRIMQEALLHDPLAPKGVPHPRVPSRTVYKGQDILDYIQSYSDDAIAVSAEIELQRRNDRREFDLEMDRMRRRHQSEHEDMLQSMGDTRKAILNLVQNTLDRAVDITKAANTSCGVYFLRKGDEIVYVGQSISVYGRVAQHKREKDFDTVTFLPCQPEDLNNLEGFFIRLLRPRLNGSNAYNGSGRGGAPTSWLWGDVVSLDASLVRE